MINLPQNDKRYSWTFHAKEKMEYYGISPSRVRRIVRKPTRVEEGIASNTVAAMQPAGTKRHQEIWVMYRTGRDKDNAKKIRIITAWRYPGESPERNPVPLDILEDIKSLL